MRITAARVIVTSPGRNFVTLKIETDEGVHGIGDATVNGRELAVAAYLSEHVIPVLIGRDASRIEDMWQSLYKGAYWRRGPITMAAISAVDTALWDIKAKAAGMPLYQLLGGRSRDGVTVYGHASGSSIDAVLAEVALFVGNGYRAVRVQGGPAGTYGISASPAPTGDSAPPLYEPASSALPFVETWSTPRYLSEIPGYFQAVREEFGPELRLVHDAHHRLTPIEAARLGKSLEPYALTWMEDPVPAELQSGYQVIRQHTTTPIAVGEVFNTIWDCEELIRTQSIDYIRSAVTHAGGVSHLRRILDFASVYHVRSAQHGAADLSPVCLSAALHLDIAIPNFGLQEWAQHSSDTDRVFPHGYRYEDGYLLPAETPGLGVDIDEELAATFPYQAASLPINRLEDGTLHSW